jgi:hypothetical protein
VHVYCAGFRVKVGVVSKDVTVVFVVVATHESWLVSSYFESWLVS